MGYPIESVSKLCFARIGNDGVCIGIASTQDTSVIRTISISGIEPTRIIHNISQKIVTPVADITTGSVISVFDV
jgi:hypothetical protein